MMALIMLFCINNTDNRFKYDEALHKAMEASTEIREINAQVNDVGRALKERFPVVSGIGVVAYEVGYKRHISAKYRLAGVETHLSIYKDSGSIGVIFRW